ncbi:MAG TPA: HD domain-containing protein [Isosphaeraceae bacterium]|jgi:hypothetical protein
MRWNDRVYGDVSIDDPLLLALIQRPTFQRLRGIKQAGPSAIAYPFKTVTRFEHCLGVFILLRRLGACRKEQVAGLLHDISHTAFSHAVDFIVTSDEQDHHEGLKPEFLRPRDISSAIAALGYEPRDFYDDSVFPLLERPIPWLCADRIDYFLRDSLTCGVTTPDEARLMLDDLVVVGDTIAFADASAARMAVARFAAMNRDWWAGEGEGFIYNEFADALREGFDLGVLTKADLRGDDAHVLSCLHSARSPLIDAKLDRIAHFKPEYLAGYVARVEPKVRWLDPPVVHGCGYLRLSEIDS